MGTMKIIEHRLDNTESRYNEKINFIDLDKEDKLYLDKDGNNGIGPTSRVPKNRRKNSSQL
jgi:hypothetical protein